MRGFEKWVLEQEEIGVRLYRTSATGKEAGTEGNGRWQQLRSLTS